VGGGEVNILNEKFYFLRSPSFNYLVKEREIKQF
jgi:hypothetical protein